MTMFVPAILKNVASGTVAPLEFAGGPSLVSWVIIINI